MHLILTRNLVYCSFICWFNISILWCSECTKFKRNILVDWSYGYLGKSLLKCWTLIGFCRFRIGNPWFNNSKLVGSLACFLCLDGENCFSWRGWFRRENWKIRDFSPPQSWNERCVWLGIILAQLYFWNPWTLSPWCNWIKKLSNFVQRN